MRSSIIQDALRLVWISRMTKINLLVNHPINFLIGAFDEEELVGMVGFVKWERIKTGHKGDIWGMFVNPEFQGKRIGSALVSAAIEKAFEIDELQQINLSVEANNQAATGLYQKMGFQQWGLEENAMLIDGEMFDLVYMVKGK